ncbi:P63C domain protein [Bacteroidales bacterium Barb6]|nr:P63C domain protein [Bacteroidales bacterium Barb6]
MKHWFMENKILKAKYGSDKTPLKLGELEIPCYVLEDGTRVFSGRSIQKVLDSSKPGNSWLPSFFKKSLVFNRIYGGENSFIDRINNPIKFSRIDAGGSQSATNGYEVTLLIDICSAIIDANRGGEFEEQNMVTNADIIIRSVAKVGIIALVDEATGYQYDREKHELQRILKAYIAEELLPWQKRFPDIYYKELFRLNGWEFTITGIKKRPGVIGAWTNKLIYEQLPKGVLEELKSKIPKSESGNKTARYHQFLTLDMGEPNLTAQIKLCFDYRTT